MGEKMDQLCRLKRLVRLAYHIWFLNIISTNILYILHFREMLLHINVLEICILHRTRRLHSLKAHDNHDPHIVQIVDSIYAFDHGKGKQS